MSRMSSSLTSCIVAGGMFCMAAAPAVAQSTDNSGVVYITDSTNGYPAANCRAEQEGVPYFVVKKHHNGYHFSPPVKRPIYRSPVSYTKGFPDAWTGQQPYGGQPAYRAPTVYMPTDTTQLGYYYQTVPYWQPKPGAVPPPPVPSQWHTTVGQMQYQGHHPAGIIYGTAPTAVPHTPAPPPWDGQGLPPAPEVSPTPAQSVQGQAQPVGLERTASSPELLPIQ